MEWIIGIVLVALVLYLLGRAKGAPDPAPTCAGKDRASYQWSVKLPATNWRG